MPIGLGILIFVLAFGAGVVSKVAIKPAWVKEYAVTWSDALGTLKSDLPYYTPSEEGFQVFDTPLGKIGIVVCFDRHYPESVRTEALKGAELILIPTANTKAEPSALFQWEIKVQAFQNSVNIAMCNRVGLEGETDFSGESIVADFNGETLVLADDREQLLFAEVDLSAARQTRERKPYTSLRRAELYG